MVTRYLFNFLLITAGLFGQVSNSQAQPATSEGQVKVAMRMIGHKLLLLSGDSTSRVLPVKKVEARYKIEFESEFDFIPGEIVAIIDSVINQTQISLHYLVEIEDCKTQEVVYSYEIDLTDEDNSIPCQKREQPVGCFTLFFTILEPKNTMGAFDDNLVTFPSSNTRTHSPKSSFNAVWLLLPFVLILGVFIWLRMKKKTKTGQEIIHIGEYEFDKLNMQLSFKNKTTELSGKESDLLFLLYTSVNTTLERESILKAVWGDEGDYVGRTMDVFISKLRKKLADDSNLKIINIRGVGYKFVVNK